MTNEKGEFTIKVPTFATALYFHAPQFLSQQVPVSKEGVTVKMLADHFGKMYGTSTDILADRAMTVKHTTSQSVETDIQNIMGADVRTITAMAVLATVAPCSSVVSTRSTPMPSLSLWSTALCATCSLPVQ